MHRKNAAVAAIAALVASVNLHDTARADEAIRERASLSGHTDEVNSIAFSPDGTTLISGSQDKTVRVWEVETGKERAVIQLPHVATCVDYSSDGKTFAAGSSFAFGFITLWDAPKAKEQGTIKRQVKGVTSGVLALAFSPDGKSLAVSNYDKTIQLWDLAAGKEQVVFTGHTSSAKELAFSSDGKTLASTSWDETIKLWEVATGKEKASFHYKWPIISVAFSPDGKTLAVGGRPIKLWDLTTLKERASLEPTLKDENPTLRGSVVAFSPDSKVLASVSPDRKTIRLWDVAKAKQVAAMSGHTAGVSSVAFSPDGKMLATGSSDKTIKLWNLMTK